MSVKNFIPQIWSARLLEHLDKAHVYANLVNRDYEGEIRNFGDTVKVNQMAILLLRIIQREVTLRTRMILMEHSRY